MVSGRSIWNFSRQKPHLPHCSPLWAGLPALVFCSNSQPLGLLRSLSQERPRNQNLFLLLRSCISPHVLRVSSVSLPWKYRKELFLYSALIHLNPAMLKCNRPSFYVVVLITFQLLDIGDLSHRLVFSNIDEPVQGATCVIRGSCRSHSHTADCT